MARNAEFDHRVLAASRYVPGGAALTLDRDVHGGKTIQLDTLAGTTITLPAAVGSGVRFHFCTSVIATSGSHKVQVGNTTDVMSGSLNVVDNADGTCTAFGTVAASDTITLNRSSSGSAKIGEYFWVEDIKAGYWSVNGTVIGTGGEATPFSAAVS